MAISTPRWHEAAVLFKARALLTTLTRKGGEGEHGAKAVFDLVQVNEPVTAVAAHRWKALPGRAKALAQSWQRPTERSARPPRRG